MAPALAVSTESPGVALAADATALVMCGTTCPEPDQSWIESVGNQFVGPTHPGADIDYVAVRTPEEYWPITGLFRVIGTAVGDRQMWRPGGPGWPDVPWWKLTGLFDLTIDQSLEAGVADLEDAMAEHSDDPLIIYGYSQSAAIAMIEKRKLAQQYPAGTTAPNIRFVIGGDTNLPNGGLNSRFAGLYIPILDLTFNGPEPTDTQFPADVITIQYDGAADFPLYPLNLVATLNALLGFVYLHSNPFDVTLAPDPSTALQGTHGDSTYYFFETEDLPLFAPLRDLGVPEALIDIVEPLFRVLVELGYDRSISPWEFTPARLFPSIDPVTVAVDLVEAVGEGIENAAAIFTPPPPPVPAPAVTSADEQVADGEAVALVTHSSPTLTQPQREVSPEEPAQEASTAALGAAETSEPPATIEADDETSTSSELSDTRRPAPAVDDDQSAVESSRAQEDQPADGTPDESAAKADAAPAASTDESTSDSE
ncbi:PE-PPE domain-containing protein [Mycolicibacterium flavescens]|nr:PE-PPE domain-containing protein [Mycolicibacterium flavescens]